MKNLLMILFLLASSAVYAQRITITGTVTDEKRAPLPGATIQVRGTTQGTTSGEGGRYSLEVSSSNDVLVFSFVGYTSKEIPVQNQTTISVTLEPVMTGLDEVVVVGYGTQKKSDITGTVGSLPKGRLEMVPNLNVAQAIQGSMAGVMIQNSVAGARGEQSILIRGRNSITASNDPLIILDGIPYSGRMSDINPNDVGSIEVLKDASAAAIYGSRGSNGVIIITSKEGITTKPTLTYEGKYSIQDLTKVPRLLTGPEFYEFKKTRYPSSLTLSEQEVFNDGSWTDWMNLATRQGHSQEHFLSVSGNANNTKYYIGGGLTDVVGVAENDKFRRISSRMNIETKVFKWLTLGTRTQLTFDDDSGEEVDFYVAKITNPLGHAYDANGKQTLYPWPDNIIVQNPLQELLFDSKDKSFQVVTNNYLNVDFPFVKGLSYRLNTGVRIRTTDYGRYEGRNTASGLADLGHASISNAISNNTVIENIVSLNRTFGNHTIFATALYSYEGSTSTTNAISADKFPNDFLTWYAIASAEVKTPSNTYSKSNLLSQMLRLNYSYQSRYLVTLTVRRDGYSGFGDKSKWGTFPSVALGWNIAKESFFPAKDILNELKLRASYGLNGNQAISPYQTISRLNAGNNSAGATTVIGYIPVSLGIDNLGWESSRTLNLGMDFGLFENRISGNINWYLTNTFDLLLSRSISPVHGITSIVQNIGETRNDGLEFVLESRNIVRNNFEWQTSANFSINRNEILGLYGLVDKDGEEIDDIANKWFIGSPIRVNYDYVFDGVWQQDEAAAAASYGTQVGFVKLKDTNGDGTLNSADRQIIGQQDPKFIWGLTNTLKYRNFGLSIFLHGIHGATTQNFLINDEVSGAEVRYNTTKKVWWTPENPTNDWPMNALNATMMGGNTVHIYQNSSFVRLKDISLSYDLPKSLGGGSWMSKFRVFMTMRNLATITKWTGNDPELTDEDSQNGVPMQREYVFGISVGF